MTAWAARDLALSLMQKHGLDAWAFEFDRARRRFGCCKYRTRIISLSLPLTKLNDEVHVTNTILHEIAHALAGHSAGHGPVWRLTARKVGANAQRCYSEDVIKPKHKYKGTCPTCHREILRHKRGEVACGRCCGGAFNRAHLFVWTLN